MSSTPPTETEILDILRQIRYPNLDRDIVEYGVVQGVEIRPDAVVVTLEILTRDNATPELLRRDVEAALRNAGYNPVVDARVKQFPRVSPDAGQQAPPAAAGPHGTSPDPFADRQRLPGVRYVLAVSSGKGGVGKSTIAVNLALALKFRGLNVGLLDADIYGPSQPIMLGLKDVEVIADEQRRIYPIEVHGLKTISIGYLIEDGQPVIWRGPLVMKTIEQFLRGVAWGTLDVLVVDLPPGTGDAQLSLVQKTPIDGAIIVTTPADVALADVVRGHAMFESVDVPTLGIIENMSYFVCDNCDKRHELFSHGGGRQAAEERGLPFLGELPLDPTIASGSDAGKPIVVDQPSSPQADAFHDIAGKVLELLEQQVDLK
ncbi:MAG: MRP family ATP-binding protein [Candidatus Dadabacteria bacterium]|nr:MAG: MRP family ATP-binding protein [Candidatus Dadabacteria bacterium]